MLLLNASKYRVQLTPHLYRTAANLLFALSLACSVWLWDSMWFPNQFWVQLLLTLLIIAYGFQQWQKQLHLPVIFSVYQDGRWVYLACAEESKQAIQWQITAQSRFTDWLIWIQLSGMGKSHWLWIFRDEISDENYRRICLAIKYCQQVP